LGDFSAGLILAAGAILTFGAKSDLLDKLTVVDQAVYITGAFGGVALTALFMTVLANVNLKDG
jgi:hypothetical protein